MESLGTFEIDLYFLQITVCGRFNILTDVDALIATFDILQNDAEIEPFEANYNISPSPQKLTFESPDDERLTKIPIVLNQNGKRKLQSAIWPMIPIWKRGEIPEFSTANARSETMKGKATYRRAWNLGRRCLIPASGFYEWQIVAGKSTKQPWHIQNSNQPVMGFAGLWEFGQTETGKKYLSCTIVTTVANSLMAKIHNRGKRMPVIINPEMQEQWLGSDNEAAYKLARPYSENSLVAKPISTRINNPNYNQPDCINPLH